MYIIIELVNDSLEKGLLQIKKITPIPKIIIEDIFVLSENHCLLDLNFKIAKAINLIQ